jgi:ABC-type multidrug transport system fused ATPase/permease subunit
MRLSDRIIKLKKLSKELREISDSQVAGKDVIIEFGMTAYERERRNKAFSAYEEEYEAFTQRAAITAALFVLSLMLSLTAIIITTGAAVVSAEISPAGAVFLTLTVFAVFAFIGTRRILYLIRVYKSDEKPLAPEKKEIIYGGINTATDRNDIVFSGVTFTYPGSSREIFSGLSFTVKSGERFAILGKTGSGKTTLEKLIRREFDPDIGIITLGGIPLPDYNYTLLQNRLETLDFTVTDDISDVIDFDNIILINDGLVEGFGSHRKLLISSPLYRRMYEAKFGVNPYEGVDKGANFNDFLQ